jgi:hypothetical protein
VLTSLWDQSKPVNFEIALSLASSKTTVSTGAGVGVIIFYSTPFLENILKIVRMQV